MATDASAAGGTAQPQGEETTPPRPRRAGSTGRRIAINTISNWITLGAQVLSSMFLVWFVYRQFDLFFKQDVKDLFGVYRLSLTFSMAVSFLSFGMAGSVIRLASESIALEDWKRLSGVASVARTFLLITGGLGAVGVTLVSIFLLDLLKVPPGLQPATRTLFQLTGVAGAIQMMYVLYRGLLQARQRFELSNTSLLVQIGVNIGLLVLLFSLGYRSLEVAGWSLLVGSVCGLLMQVFMVRRVLPHLQMHLFSFPWKAAKEVFAFGAWMTVGQASRQAMGMAGFPIVSAALGTGAAGEYGIPQMISANIRRVIAGITLPLRPVATKYAVLGQREKLARLYRTGTRLSMMMVVLPIAILVTHGRLFIIHWTGPEMESVYSVTMLSAGLLFLARVGIPAEHFITATGRISDVMLTRLAASALGVGGALVVAKLGIGGLHGIVVALFLPTALRGFIYLPWRVTLEVPVTWGTTVFGCVLPPLLACTVPIFSGWLLLKAWTPESFLGVLFQMGLAALTYAPVVWFILLSADERGIIRRALLPAGLNQRLAKG